MEKNILIALVIIVVVIILACAGYFVYINYFITSPAPPPSNLPDTTASPGGPKEAYIKYLTNASKAETLEDFYKITLEYGSFDSPEQKNEASVTSTADIKKMSPSQKIQELRYLRDMSKSEIITASQLVETVSGDIATLSSLDGGLIINMVKEQGSWKIK